MNVLVSLAEKIALTNKMLNESFREYFNDDFENLRTISTPYGELGTILYHIFKATNVWVNRISGQNAIMRSYEELITKNDFYDEWIMVDQRFVTLSKETEFDYSKMLRVTTKSGEDFTVTVEDALLHLSHHSFQHRGNLGSIIRSQNLKPLPGLDWIDANLIERFNTSN